MPTLKSTVYNLLAPIARRWLGHSIATKQIKGSNGLQLSYPKAQHLGFLGQREIEYEFELQQLVLKEIEKGQLIFEIGSNIGQYSLPIAQKLGNEGRLICIEPDTDNFAFLERNIKANSLQQVILLNKAVGEQQGSMQFYKDTVTGGRSGSLFKQFAGKSFVGKTENVAVTTFEALIDQYGTPDFVKVDVEGAEVMIFKPVSQLPQSTIYFVEVRQETASTIFELFRSQFFRIYSLDKGMKEIVAPESAMGFDNWIIRMP